MSKNIVFSAERNVEDSRPIDIRIGGIVEPSRETEETERGHLPPNIDDDLYDLNPATIKKDKDIQNQFFIQAFKLRQMKKFYRNPITNHKTDNGWSSPINSKSKVVSEQL